MNSKETAITFVRIGGEDLKRKTSISSLLFRIEFDSNSWCKLGSVVVAVLISDRVVLMLFQRNPKIVCVVSLLPYDSRFNCMLVWLLLLENFVYEHS